VREMVEVCYNNTHYLDQKVQGDYIKQIFILTHNPYFHREITLHQEKRYQSVSFFMIYKTDNVSSVKLCERQNVKIPTEKENYNPVKNSYVDMWDDLKKQNSPIPVLNAMRRILEYYFLQLCGYEGTDIRKIVLEDNKDKFVVSIKGAQPDYSRYHLADAMLSYISNSNGISDGLNYFEDFADVEQYKAVFKLIFESLQQEQHYNIMMGQEELLRSVVSF
jgi:wobble nucleotide-excising tRNase